MTENRWLTAVSNPYAMINFLKERVSPRKARLFAVACVRNAPTPPTHPWELRAVEVGERFADDRATNEELRAAEDAACGQAGSSFWAAASDSWWDAVEAARFSGDTPKLLRLQCDLVRCVFGNPFRPVVPDPVWLTSDVVLLASGVYEEKAFDRLPILADALQDAGCDNHDVLQHCRGVGPHTRGCWVVDLVLGKS